MKVHPEGLRGLRMLDDRGDYLIDVKWDVTHTGGSWITRTIPAGYRIVDIVCNTHESEYTIASVGFVLAKIIDSN